jgi:rubrerythrin
MTKLQGSVLGAVLLGTLIAGAPVLAQETGKEKATIIEHLQHAYNGESNAHARYLAFAKKADEEGYGQVASLFRAAANAEQVHATRFSETLKKMGQTPKADVKTPEVKSTK